VKTIHLRDFAEGRRHAFIGEGKLDLATFFAAIDRKSLQAITLECSLSSRNRPQQAMSQQELISRAREARQRLESWLT
jgi:sugar phosphate isomerase/epimerase